MQSLTETKEKKGGFKRWVPKRWSPVYDQVVLLSVAGRSNTEIAKIFEFTPQHVSNIITTPQAALIRAEVSRKLRERAADTIPEKLEAAAAKAAQRVKDVIEDDDLFERSPFAVVDRSLKVLQATGYIKGEQDRAPIRERTLVIPAELALRMLEGMARIDEAQKRLPPAQDVDFEVVKSGTHG